MEKMMGVSLRSVYRSVWCRSYRMGTVNHQILRHYYAGRTFFNFSIPPTSMASRHAFASSDCRSPLSMGLGSTRSYSEDVTHLPVIKDPGLHRAFKDLLAASWNELPDSLIYEVKTALSKNTDDEAGKEAVTNVFRAAEAVEKFGDIIMNFKMKLDDTIGMSGENVKPLSDEYVNALRTIFSRYTTYLDAFGPEETYLRKKVETELGSKMIYLKMRCGGIGSEWGKVTVLGTSGLAGSYVEQRA
ncbi:Succinate dehydrogenase subunit 5, mitochondrial [Parasponia andersonii]|uniref:Succinate dehydrogenase subunit 5, mitochondrial n=1 Tax=Parasponia andersonii TaxID=3476 RepID=A0A2P5AST2_PARAD|nr:Succinate dehydrogenase subunit 5, mitochondrial [Parasponia andersonii]